MLAESASLRVRITGQEHAAAVGTARIEVFDLASLEARPDCLTILKALATGDADYAAGKEIATAVSTSSGNARETFLRTVAAYASAEKALDSRADQQLRGETALALAGIQYFDLQDWAAAAGWAEAAAAALASIDPYRAARAHALLAAAWIEIGSSGAAGAVSGVTGKDLLAKAHDELHRLVHFHLQRGERYDAGLQLTNIGLTYLNEGNYPGCVDASAAASHLFGSIHETQRRAQAWQNQALCLWGLGRLPEALHWFERALADIGPEPYPSIYLAVTTNT
ncbi:MAG: hypothetical protein JO299_09855, partial [Gammaproteobacteria bacterium]|nr:hypothetical protein [Gammaproteobacteria bacterium]